MARRRSGVLVGLIAVLWCGLDARAAEAQCTFSVSPTIVNAPSTGMNSSISVITGSACAWSPSTTDTWITITSGGMSGLGSFSFTVAANGAGTPRTGTIAVGGQVVTVNQSTGNCTYSVSPMTVSAPSTGLTSAISVITGSSCAWTPASTAAWITVTSGGMSGLGSFSYTVAPNGTGAPRSGTLTVGGQVVTVNQSTGSCTYSVTPSTVVAPFTGLNSSIAVVTGSGCPWTATSTLPWIVVTSGGMSGLGSISFTVQATTAPRTGTFTVAGQTVTINQSNTNPPAPPANLRILVVAR